MIEGLNFLKYLQLDLSFISKSKIAIPLALSIIFDLGAILHRFFKTKQKPDLSIPLNSLKKGYAIIPFSSSGNVDDLFNDLKCFDLQSESYKQQFSIKDHIEVGYSSFKYKNVFVVRNQNIPEQLKEFIPYFSAVNSIALDILKKVEKDLGMQSSELTKMTADQPLPSAEYSTSLLRLFAYKPSTDEVVADAHEDLGLLTVIPISEVPSLEIYDYEQSTWINLEKMGVGSQAIILVGRTLEKLTHGKYQAATHRVVGSVHPRYSIVYQLRAEPHIKISKEMNVAEWLALVKKNLHSVNGSY